MRGLLLAVLMLHGASARADDWYGHHVLAVDAVGSATLVTGAKLDHETVIFAGAFAMMFGAGIVHLAHDDQDAAGYATGMRLGLTYLGGQLGVLVASCEGLSCLEAKPFYVGMALGYLTAATLDVVLLSTEETDPTTPRMLSFGGRF